MLRPPFHPQVQALHDAVHLPPLTPDTLTGLRAQNEGDPTDISSHGLERRDVEIGGSFDAPITVSTWRRPGTTGGPAFVFLHGGGMVSGDRFACGDIVPHVLDHGGVLVSVEYRLAPEHPAPTPVEDCVDAVSWVIDHAGELGHDGCVLLAGTSAGGGLAAGVLLALRDRHLTTVAGAWLNTPMLDDTTSTLSACQYDSLGLFWTGVSNRTAWELLRGEAHTLRPYDAPARAGHLRDLPPLLITVGSAEPFRDETVAFASRVWADGGACTLHVADGGSHCFDAVLPDSAIARAQDGVVRAWFASVLDPDDPADAADAIAAAKQDERHYH